MLSAGVLLSDPGGGGGGGGEPGSCSHLIRKAVQLQNFVSTLRCLSGEDEEEEEEEEFVSFSYSGADSLKHLPPSLSNGVPELLRGASASPPLVSPSVATSPPASPLSLSFPPFRSPCVSKRRGRGLILIVNQ